MLSSDVIEGSNIVTVTYDGSVGTDDMIAVRERLNGVIRERGSARLLVEYGDVELGRVERRAVWEDLSSATLVRGVTKAAVVADQGWVDTLVSVVGSVLPVSVRSFDRDRRDDAVAWLYS